MTPSPPPPDGHRPKRPDRPDAVAEPHDAAEPDDAAEPGPDDPIDEGALDERLETGQDPLLGDALRALLAPSGDVRGRATDKVDRTLQGRSIISTLTDLWGVGWVTVAHLLTNPDDGADRNERNEDRDD